MAKNVIVTDAKGNFIGSTYPKRARGLVKHGRAVYVDDCIIRLLHTTAPSVVTKNDNKEHFFIKNIIEFKSKDFRFGSQNKYGGRTFVTLDGRNTEVFDLGTVDAGKGKYGRNRDHDGTWIFSKKTLEPHTDSDFRVEVTCDGTMNEDSDLRIAIFDVLDHEDKTSYQLGQSRFEPVISKKASDGGLVRVFELPYSTGDGSEYQINIFAYDCRVTLDAPAEPEAYASLKDCSYAEWCEGPGAKQMAENKTACGSSTARILSPEALSALECYYEMMKQGALSKEEYDNIKTSILGGMIGGTEQKPAAESAAEAAARFVEAFTTKFNAVTQKTEDDDEDDDDDSVIDVRDKSYDENGFARLLERIGDGCVASVYDVNVTSAAGASYSADDMYQADGATLDFKGLDATTAAFSMVISKIGDGSNVVIRGSNEIVNEKQMNSDESERFDGTVLSICDSQLSAFTACKIIAALGDGCNVEFRNCSITSDGAFLAEAFADDPDPSDGTLISFRGSSVPEELKKLVEAKAENSDGFSYEF